MEKARSGVGLGRDVSSPLTRKSLREFLGKEPSEEMTAQEAMNTFLAIVDDAGLGGGCFVNRGRASKDSSERKASGK